MHRSLRQILIESHVAAVTIVVLLLWTLDGAFQTLSGIAPRIFHFLLTAVSIHEIPALLPTTKADEMELMVTAGYFYWAAVSFAASWLLARWVYRAGPLCSLARYQNLIGKNNV